MGVEVYQFTLFLRRTTKTIPTSNKAPQAIAIHTPAFAFDSCIGSLSFDTLELSDTTLSIYDSDVSRASSFCKFSSKFETAGINQTVHKIYVNILKTILFISFSFK